MTMVMWSPKKGGIRHRQFKSFRRARDFARCVWRQDFAQSSCLAHYRHGKALRLEQYIAGQLNYSAKHKHNP